MDLLDQRVDASDRFVVGGPGRLALANLRVDHDQRRVSDIVVDHHVFGQREEGIGQTDPVGVRIGDLLDESNPVVADHADGPADESRQRQLLGLDRLEVA
jgi:hypothetical protein